jgi:hypothetical protein
MPAAIQSIFYAVENFAKKVNTHGLTSIYSLK